MKVDGVEVIVENLDGVTEDEIKKYIAIAKQEARRDDIIRLVISDAREGKVALEYVCANQPFERIRRITGYLVGTIDRWNNAKRAEEHDRVKHGLNI